MAEIEARVVALETQLEYYRKEGVVRADMLEAMAGVRQDVADVKNFNEKLAEKMAALSEDVSEVSKALKSVLHETSEKIKAENAEKLARAQSQSVWNFFTKAIVVAGGIITVAGALALIATAIKFASNLP